MKPRAIPRPSARELPLLEEAHSHAFFCQKPQPPRRKPGWEADSHSVGAATLPTYTKILACKPLPPPPVGLIVLSVRIAG